MRQDQVAANKRRAALLMAVLLVVLEGLALALNGLVGGGVVGALVASGLVVLTATAVWSRSEAVALGMSSVRPADPVEHARLHNLVDGLCIGSGLPRPSVLVVDDEAMNAFAIGRHPRRASVVVTTGLLEKLNRIELEAVLAHELSHVKSHDTLVSTLAVTTVAMAAVVSEWVLPHSRMGDGRHSGQGGGGRGGGGSGGLPATLLLVVGLLLLPLVAVGGRAMQLAVGRRREVLADTNAMSITRYPPGLVSALEKLRDGHTVVGCASRATAHLWIEPPLPPIEARGRLAWVGRLFETHPPLEERIQLLREM